MSSDIGVVLGKRWRKWVRKLAGSVSGAAAGVTGAGTSGMSAPAQGRRGVGKKPTEHETTERIRARLAAGAGNSGGDSGSGGSAGTGGRTDRSDSHEGYGGYGGYGGYSGYSGYGGIAGFDARTIAEAVRAECPGIGARGVLRQVRAIEADITGAGPLEELLDRAGVTDVLVNGAAQVWVDTPAGLRKVPSPFADDPHVRATAVRLASACGRRLDDASPCADGFYQRPDGAKVRVHAILPPLVEHPCVSLRVLGGAKQDLNALVAGGTVSAEMAAELKAMVAARESFLVSGGTGSGKTTMLSALLAEVDQRERIICVEDTRELQPHHPHVVALTTTTANVEGAGEVTLPDLVRQCLRMRPDRIVVGEIRGAEIADLFAALNTGHDGGAGTIHANGPAEIPARCQALGAMGGMAADVVRVQMAAAIGVVVHMVREGNQRRVGALGVMTPAGEVQVVWTAEGGRTAAWQRWRDRVGMPRSGQQRETGSRLVAEGNTLVAPPEGVRSLAVEETGVGQPAGSCPMMREERCVAAPAPPHARWQGMPWNGWDEAAQVNCAEPNPTESSSTDLYKTTGQKALPRGGNNG